MSDAVTPKRASGVQPPPDLVAKVRGLVETDGEARVAKLLSVGKTTVTRLRFGLPCRPGTIELARQKLAAL